MFEVYFDKFDSTKRKPVWDKGVISARDFAPRRYTVEGDNGRDYKRNRVHILPDTATALASFPPYVQSEPCDSDNSPEPNLTSDSYPTDTDDNPSRPTEASDLAPALSVHSPRPTRSCGPPKHLSDYDLSGPKS